MEIIVYLFLNGPVLCGKENNKKRGKRLGVLLGKLDNNRKTADFCSVTLNVSPDRQKLLLKHLIILFTSVSIQMPTQLLT